MIEVGQRSEAQQRLEQARRHATHRSQGFGEALRPRIDRADHRLGRSTALRDAAARLRSARLGAERRLPAAGSGRTPSGMAWIQGRLGDVVEQQRTTNELLRSLLDRVGGA